MAYASTTEVPVERTRAEIEKLVMGHKCSQYVTGTDNDTRKAMVQFRAYSRIVRFVITLPDRKDRQFTHKSSWQIRATAQADKLFAQAERQRWRALLLVIKAKLEAVESKIATFEEEFMAQIVMPNDRTVGQMVTPMIQRAYETGQMPQRMLPAAIDDVVEGEQVG